MGRDPRDCLIRRANGISIHAPRMGRDCSSQHPQACGRHFNPRAPYGARQPRTLYVHRPHEFQSTRPVWGATVLFCRSAFVCGISIHAPRMGRDSYAAMRDEPEPRFQSTRPVWGATKMVIGERLRLLFQSTRPVWGATIGIREMEDAVAISIHAPRMGRDSYHKSIQCRPYGISIHAPRMGRDPSMNRLWLHAAGFQSTRPVWGATY